MDNAIDDKKKNKEKKKHFIVHKLRFIDN